MGGVIPTEDNLQMTDAGLIGKSASGVGLSGRMDAAAIRAFIGSLTQSQIESLIAAAVAALVDSSPGTLDTLNELAAALGDDPNFAATTAAAIAAKYTKPGAGIPSTDLASAVQDLLTLAGTALQSLPSHNHDDLYMRDAEIAAAFAALSHGHDIADVTGLQTALDGKQATLISGTNLKTVNGSSLLGAGDLSISGGSAADAMRAQTGVYYNAQEPDAFLSSVTITANTLYLLPTCHETTETWNELYTYVNTIGAGGTCRMGIYTSDHANGPTFTRLKDAGTVSVATTGLKTISGMSQSIDGGKIVYLALLCDVTWTNLGTTFANLKKRLIRGHAGGFNFGGIIGYQKASVSYASGLPASVTGLNNLQTNCPTIGMRI